MTAERQTEHARQISAETEGAVREFVTVAVLHLNNALNAKTLEWEVQSRWERGTDGHFRTCGQRIPRISPILNDNWMRSVPDYDACVNCLKSDEIVGPHLERLVGTNVSARRLEPDDILRSLVYAMLDDDGVLRFTGKRFAQEWREWTELFCGERIAYKLVAPLPHLAVQRFPLPLNNELVVDRLDADEVTRCYQVGVLRPQIPQFPLIDGEVAVGVRRTTMLPKVIRVGDEPSDAPPAADEGSFGHRAVFRGDLVIDDVSAAHSRLR
jgi:hypothetical protein